MVSRNLSGRARARVSLVVAAALVAALSSLALTGVAGAGSAKGKANTKVTIQGGGGLVEGEVKSSDENHCANQRKVLIYEVKNGNADKVASDRATQNGDRYQWAKAFPGGKYFAKVAENSQCKGDSTKTVNAGHL